MLGAQMKPIRVLEIISICTLYVRVLVAYDENNEKGSWCMARGGNWLDMHARV